jgi:hypothetical protein
MKTAGSWRYKEHGMSTEKSHRKRSETVQERDHGGAAAKP